MSITIRTEGDIIVTQRAVLHIAATVRESEIIARITAARRAKATTISAFLRRHGITYHLALRMDDAAWDQVLKCIGLTASKETRTLTFEMMAPRWVRFLSWLNRGWGERWTIEVSALREKWMRSRHR